MEDVLHSQIYGQIWCIHPKFTARSWLIHQALDDRHRGRPLCTGHLSRPHASRLGTSTLSARNIAENDRRAEVRSGRLVSGKRSEGENYSGWSSLAACRSEERRVGKECRTRWATVRQTKK